MVKKELIKQLIVDFQQELPVEVIPRELSLPTDSNKIITGSVRSESQNKSLKEREVHAAIYPFLYKMRVVLERVCLAMLQDEQAVFLQQIVGKYQIGDGLQVGQLVRRVGKDEVELLATTLNVLEHIASDRQALVGIYLPHHFADESIVVTVFLYTDDLLASA